MKIINLKAENVKRLHAVEVTPDGNLVVIAGKNGAGKSSLLDSIWMALGGGPALKGTTKPIREGEESAAVTLDLGDLIVTRTWNDKATKLTVTSKDGAKYGSPQAMLDGIVGSLSFDPLAFSQQDERTQLKTLLDLVDLPFDPLTLDADRKDAFEQRTLVNREAKQLEAQLAGLPKPLDGLPDTEVSTSDVLSEYRAAEQAHRESKDLRVLLYAAKANVERLEFELTEARGREESLANAVRDLPSLPDLDAIQARLESVEDINRQIRDAAEWARVKNKLADRAVAGRALTERLDEIDTTKATALAEASMPIDGLAFDDSGVTYLGVPFKQCSSAERLRVSMAMAMALNPKLRVIRIVDGSLLDSDNMRLIEEMASEHDFQCWIEVVSDAGDVGIVIEDGSVVSVNGVAVKA
jgi:DNA repair exonuclease SbcCD ATPase subunit